MFMFVYLASGCRGRGLLGGDGRASLGAQPTVTQWGLPKCLSRSWDSSLSASGLDFGNPAHTEGGSQGEGARAGSCAQVETPRPGQSRLPIGTLARDRAGAAAHATRTCPVPLGRYHLPKPPNSSILDPPSSAPSSKHLASAPAGA